MEIVTTPAGNGAKQWLSELGLEEPSLVRHLDSLVVPSVNQFHSIKGYQNHNAFDLSGSFLNVKQRDSHITMNNYFPSGYPSQWDALLNPERPAKMPKTTNSWDSSFSNQVLSCNSISHQPLLPLIYSHKSQQQCQPQPQQHQQNHLNQLFSPQQQLACQNLEGFVASLPKLSDDMNDSVAPRTPTTEFGGSQVLGGGAQDTCTSDVLSIEAMSSVTHRDSSPVEESFRGKRKPEFFSSPSELKMQRPPPMAATRALSPPSKATGHTQDHIMAERKRREKLSQRFIALSAIVPGLKKMDKASVLGDAIKYVKSLQDRVQKLEEQAPKKSVSSVAAIKNNNDSKGTVSEAESGAENELECGEVPEIEARVNDKNVLIKMHCENKKGVVVKCLTELEKLHLVVMNASIMSFTTSALDVTLSAQLEDGHEVTADDIVGALQSFFKSLQY